MAHTTDVYYSQLWRLEVQGTGRLRVYSEPLSLCVSVCLHVATCKDANNMINKNPVAVLEIPSLLVVPWVQDTESSPS